MKTVLVSCDIVTLRRREAERGDRCAGSAEASLQYLYPKTGYDLCVDSSKASSAALAEKMIKEALNKSLGWMSEDVFVSRGKKTAGILTYFKGF